MKKFKPTNKSASKILAPSIVIPPYQRGYAWEPKNAKDFFEDFLQFLKEFSVEIDVSTERFNNTLLDNIQDQNEMFYLGQLVFMDDNVVDGQQRLTTLLILFKAINDYRLDNGMNEIKSSFLESNGENKLIPSKQDSDISKKLLNTSNWADFVVNLSKEEKEKARKTKQFRVYKILKQLINEQSWSELATDNFIKAVQKVIYFSVVELDNETEALQFFEIMNSKSVELSPADLIKNNLIASSNNKTSAANSWNAIIDNMGDDHVSISKFVRYVYISLIGKVSLKTLFEKITSKETTDEIDLVTELNNYLEPYRYALGSESTDDLYVDSILNAITTLGAKESLLPIIMTILKVNSDKMSESIPHLEELLSFSFQHFYLRGFKANAYSASVTDICKLLRAGDKKPFKSLWDAFESSGDGKNKKVSAYELEWFEGDSNNKNKAKRFAKSIFPLVYAKKRTQENYAPEEGKLESITFKNLDIEHIFPSSKKSAWITFEGWEDAIWNAGNLVPISYSLNRKAKDALFPEKFDWFMNPRAESNRPKSALFKSLVIDLMKKTKEEYIVDVERSTSWDKDMISKRTKAVFEEAKDLNIFNLK